MPIPQGSVHDVKILPEFFKAWKEGRKRAEFRNMDRGYQVGDRVNMWEWDPKKKKYTGRCIQAEILHIDLAGKVMALSDAFIADIGKKGKVINVSKTKFGVLSMAARSIVRGKPPAA